MRNLEAVYGVNCSYYHCTGKRGGTCKKDYIREKKLNELFLQLIDKLPNPKEGLFEEIKKAIVEIRKIKTGYEQTNVNNLTFRYSINIKM